MLYVALLFLREGYPLAQRTEGEEAIQNEHLAKASYDMLSHATGLSRSLIRQGLQRLEELEVITPRGSPQNRSYELAWDQEGWFKLPCRAIVDGGSIKPFHLFTLRSRFEMHAMKLYLYFASIRDRNAAYSQATYEKIHERLGIPERDIRRGVAVLINAGLLQNVAREEAGLASKWSRPNSYYLTGSHQLFSK